MIRLAAGRSLDSAMRVFQAKAKEGWMILRSLSCILVLFVAWQSHASPPDVESSQPAVPGEVHEAPSPEKAPTLEERNQALLQMHSEIWSLMGLSQKATEELNEIVVSINTKVHENEHKYPEQFAKARAVKRSELPLTHEEYLASHKRRFELLGISRPTQQELIGALQFTWKALHDPAVPEHRREAAIKIREMMKSMEGPPPCCDDNIFVRAGMGD
jgi:hypothetical protein